jgi:hypothetical protein
MAVLHKDDDILVTDLSIRCYNSLGWLCLLVEAI